MKKFVLFILLSVSLFAEDVINVASEEYGALTSKDKNAVEIKLPVKTNVDEIKLSFKPNKGKLIVLSKEDKKEKEIAAIVLDGTEEEASFKLQKLFLKDVRVVFVPDDLDKPLTLYSYAFNVVDTKAIQMYTSLQKSIASIGNDIAAGASTENVAVSASSQVVPVTLPTEFTISKASL